MLATIGERRLRRILTRLLDENEFLGPYGLRSRSRAHGDTPCVLDLGGEQHQVRYEPAVIVLVAVRRQLELAGRQPSDGLDRTMARFIQMARLLEARDVLELGRGANAVMPGTTRGRQTKGAA